MLFKLCFKGSNCRTDCYSALEPEVNDPADISTELNHDLLSKLKISDQVSIGGVVVWTAWYSII